MQYIIGLTGLIGSGKSAVATMFNELGVSVIDTDAIAHKITAPGGIALAPIVARFGQDVIATNGGLDRHKMRHQVFTNAEQRIDLERILHPLIFSAALSQIRESSGRYVVVMVPLLFRAVKYLNLIQRSIFIDCTESTLIKRVISRSGLAANEVKAIIKTQMPREIQLKLCDDILSNNGTLSQLREQVVKLHTKYQNLFGQTCVKQMSLIH